MTENKKYRNYFKSIRLTEIKEQKVILLYLVNRYNNGRTYFFKDNLYYRFNSTVANVDSGYPKPMKNYWIGIPTKVQAAFTWYNGGVYFFKDAEFWLFVSGLGSSVNHPYPKSTENW